jgi:hypothetical protein
MYAKEPLKYSKGLNAVVKHLRKTASFTLKYPKLDINSLTLKVYTDASYANDFDGSSQLRYIIFLADACYALLRMRPLSSSWAECSVVISCGKVDYDKSG